MGFGPRLPDRDAAVQAIMDIVSLLYPERATPSALAVLSTIARALLTAGEPLAFQAIARFLNDPDWRQTVLKRVPDQASIWSAHAGQAIDPADLDIDFAWLLRDRLSAQVDRGSA